MSENEKKPTDENRHKIELDEWEEIVGEELPQTSQAFGKFISSEKLLWDVHFGPTEIPPGESVALTEHPQVLFRGKKMIAFADDDAALDDLCMQAFFVGKKSQMPMHVEPISFRRIAKGMTAEEICPGVGRGIENGFDTVDKALSLTISVINRGSVPRVARLLVMGIAVR